ncbi:MAG: hypothetical protein R3C44_14220 [Chloroflexota bacterium]
MRRSTQRIEDTIAPFDRFVRAERDRLTTQHDQLQALDDAINNLQRQLTNTAYQSDATPAAG